MGVIWEIGIADFIIVTILLGGGAAYMTGRAVAYSWQPVAKAIAWTIPLTGAVRFIHYAMFEGTLLTPHYFLVDFVILALAAVVGHRVTRYRQMTRRYGWAVEAAGFLSWRQRP